jgi:hypothetical protein
VPYITEPCHLVTHDSASAAERIAFLTSARSAQRSTRPIGSEKEGANRIACSHMLNSAHRLQVYLGHSRLDVPAIKHIEKSVTKAAKTSAATSPVRSSNARASPGCIWSRPVSPGWKSAESE